MLTPIVPVDCCASAASARSGGERERVSLRLKWLYTGFEGLLFPRLVPSPNELLAVAP